MRSERVLCDKCGATIREGEIPVVEPDDIIQRRVSLDIAGYEHSYDLCNTCRLYFVRELNNWHGTPPEWESNAIFLHAVTDEHRRVAHLLADFIVLRTLKTGNKWPRNSKT